MSIDHLNQQRIINLYVWLKEFLFYKFSITNNSITRLLLDVDCAEHQKLLPRRRYPLNHRPDRDVKSTCDVINERSAWCYESADGSPVLLGVMHAHVSVQVRISFHALWWRRRFKSLRPIAMVSFLSFLFSTFWQLLTQLSTFITLRMLKRVFYIKVRMQKEF